MWPEHEGPLRSPPTCIILTFPGLAWVAQFVYEIICPIHMLSWWPLNWNEPIPPIKIHREYLIDWPINSSYLIWNWPRLSNSKKRTKLNFHSTEAGSNLISDIPPVKEVQMHIPPIPPHLSSYDPALLLLICIHLGIFNSTSTWPKVLRLWRSQTQWR